MPTWFDPDGVEWPLNPPGRERFTLNAVTGYGLTPVSIQTRPDPRGGVQVMGIRDQARVLTWPVRVRARTHLEFLALWRALGESFALTKRKGPGLFRLTRPDGSAREVLAYYQAGWEGEPGQGQTEDTPALSLLCPDGAWRDSQPITLTRAYGESVDYLLPFPNISSGDVLGATQMTNPGTVEAWPSWTVTGPASQIVATNHTLGRTFTLNYGLSAGQTLTITTRPGRVLGPTGQMLGGALQRPGSTLWRLEPGVNDLEFAVSGSGPGTTIALTFWPRYNIA
ncbi:phage distal tail protein [Micromonospora sp. NPDC020750]|uniref:phage distal tail protein n=1 Tax=unclassified Micromonospora TaxID=2617518 RepID=UPI00379CF0ED